MRGPLYLRKYREAYALEGLPQPKKLPAVTETVPLAAVDMQLGGEAWELRCVQVLPHDGLVPVEPLPT